MKKLLYFLFPVKPDSRSFSVFLLVLRIIFGVLLMTHGLQKIANYSELSRTFPDPLGVGSSLSVSFAIFAEVACSVGFIFGAFYRLALIPMIFTMGVVFFVIHASHPFSDKELPFAYMLVFISMYIAGPGKYALDAIIAKALRKK